MDDDLTLAINLILGESPEIAAEFAKLIGRMGPSAAKAGEGVGKQAGEGQAKGYKAAAVKGMKAAMDANARAMLEGQRSANKAVLNVIDTGLKQRLEATKAAARKEAAEQDAAEAKRTATQKGNWAKRLQNNAAEIAKQAQQQKQGDAVVLNEVKVDGRQRTLAYDRIMKNIGELLRRATFQEVEERKQGDKLQLQSIRQANSLRLAEVRKANQQESQAIRISAAQSLQAQRASDRIEAIEEKGSQVRRTAVVRTGLSALRVTYATGLRVVRDTYLSGLNGITGIIKSHFSKQHAVEVAGVDRTKAILRGGFATQEAATRVGLNGVNAVYSKEARERLAIIERESARETKVISANAVKQAAAAKKAQTLSSTGIIGAATGRSAIGTGLLTGAATIGGLAAVKQTIEAASDLNEAQNKFDVVFRLLTGNAKKALQGWAESAAASLGISKQAALEQSATFGNLFSALKIPPSISANMSRTLVKLAADLASFNNVDPAVALKALQSGIVGQVRPLRQFGISLSKDRIEAEAYRLGLVKLSVDGGKVEKAHLGIESATERLAKATKKYGADSLQARQASNARTLAETALGKALGGQKVKLTDNQKAQAAYSIIMTDSALAQGDFARTSKYLANTQRIAAARLQDTKATLGRALLPLYLKFITLSTALIHNLVQGNGAFKIVRLGLLGIAGALAAIIAVKSAVQVFQLLGVGVAALAAHPLIAFTLALAALAGVLFGVLKNIDPIRRFFSSLVEGTKNWIIVGYKVGAPIKGLSNIVRITSSIGAYARGIHDFFFSLIDGFKNWAIVGYLIDGPIKGLSSIVLIQSSLGAAGRKIVDTIKGIASALKGVFDPRGSVNSARRIIGKLLGDLDDELRKLAGPVVDAVGDIFDAAKEAVRQRFGGLWKGLTSFISAGGIGAISGVLVAAVQLGVTEARKTVGDFLGSLLHSTKKTAPLLTISGAGERGADQSAAKSLGDRIHRILASVGSGGGDFLGTLFTGSARGDKGGDASTASALGKRLRDILATAVHGIGAGVSFLGALLGKGNDATEPVRKWLGGIGGSIGDFFNKSVLPKLVDVPRVLGRFISRTLFSAPVLRAITTAAAVLGGVAVGIAFQFVRGFAEGLYQRRGEIAHVLHDIISYAVKAVLGSGNPLIVLGGAIAAAFATAKVVTPIVTLISKLGELKTNVRAGTQVLRGDMEGYRQTLDTARQSAVRLNGAGFGKGIPQAANAITGAVSTVEKAYYKAGYAAVTARVKLTDAFNFVKNNPTKTLEGVLAASASIISGYFAGVADDAIGKVSGILASVGSVAGAFAVGGPVLGSLAAVGAVIGFIFGNISAQAKKAKEALAIVTAEAHTLRDGLKDSGTATPLQRARGILQGFSSDIDKGTPGASDYFRRFNVDAAKAATLLATNRKGFDLYNQTLIRSKIASIFTGQTAAVRTFSAEIAKAVQHTQGLAGQLTNTRGLDTASGQSKVSDIFEGFKNNAPGLRSIEQVRTALDKLGLDATTVKKLIGDLTSGINSGIRGSAAAKFAATLSPALRQSLKDQADLVHLQKLSNDAADAALTPTERLADRFQKLKDKIAGAVDKYRAYLDILDGGKTILAQSRISIGSSAGDAIGLGGVTADAQTVALAGGKQAFADAVGELVKQAGGDQGKLNQLLNEYKLKLAGQILPGLKEQNDALGDAKLSQQELNDRVRDYINKIVTIPESLTTELTFKPDADSLTYLQQSISFAVATGVRLGLQVPIPQPKPQGATGRKFIPGLAVGGIVRKKMLSWLGEDGPEVVIPLTKPARAKELLAKSGLVPRKNTKPAYTRDPGATPQTQLEISNTPSGLENITYPAGVTPNPALKAPSAEKLNNSLKGIFLLITAAHLGSDAAQKIVNSLKGITMLVKADPATKLLFAAYASATKAQKQLLVEHQKVAANEAFSAKPLINLPSTPIPGFANGLAGDIDQNGHVTAAEWKKFVLTIKGVGKLDPTDVKNVDLLHNRGPSSSSTHIDLTALAAAVQPSTKDPFHTRGSGDLNGQIVSAITSATRQIVAEAVNAAGPTIAKVEINEAKDPLGSAEAVGRRLRVERFLGVGSRG